MVSPGTGLTVSGFGFAPGAQVAVTLGNTGLGSAVVEDSGRFTVDATIPESTSPGVATIRALSGSTAVSTSISISGGFAARTYFPTLYTGSGYHEYLDLFNPTGTEAHTTITYERAGGKPERREFLVPAHTRVTRDVNADLGPHVSAAAVVASDLPIAVQRSVRHLTDIGVDDGAPAAARSWFFATGNTAHTYREYLSVLNPGDRAADVGFQFMPGHGRPFTLFKHVSARSRLTVNVNTYVSGDAVSAVVFAPVPIVAARTLIVQHGISSNTGIASPERQWTIAAGPKVGGAVNWLTLLNPGPAWSNVTVSAFGTNGRLLVSNRFRLRPYVPAAYPISKIAEHADVTVEVTASSPVVAEQLTYVGRSHDAMTSTFGVTGGTSARMFAAMGTRTHLGESDNLDVLNPGSSPVPFVLEVSSASGGTTQQGYVLPPRARQSINLGTLSADAQIGAQLVASAPLIALNRLTTDHGRAADTSAGVSVGP
jgi:hypothetical protein